MGKKRGFVYLVGAGPGDPGLLTIKGMECLKKADVIVYDRLASSKILAYKKPEAELIYVGKSPDKHTLTQEEINVTLVEQALQGKIVTRLKGGDPFVFGRGGEEALVLNEHDIKFEIVPGITSAIAVPAYAGIPVTHRKYSSTFGIITGNEDPNKEDSNIEWEKIATGLGTLIFLMGMANLEKIISKLITYGRSEDTPIAIIGWGTRSGQKTVTGTLKSIEAKVEAAQIKNPAIIIVGDVVRCRENLEWFEKRPLFGKKVIVTRSRKQASYLTSQIEELGGEVVEFPTINIVEPDKWDRVDEAIKAIGAYEWLIFTSVNGVELFFKRLQDLDKDIRHLAGVRICAIGPKTKEELEKYLLKVEYVPNEYVAEAIVEGLKDKIQKGDRILLARSALARDLLPKSLEKMGAQVDDIHVYQTEQDLGDKEELLRSLEQQEIDLITFTSSSTVKNFTKVLPANFDQELLKDIGIACIGPITKATAEELGLKVNIMAEEYTIDGLLSAILAHYDQQEI